MSTLWSTINLGVSRQARKKRYALRPEEFNGPKDSPNSVLSPFNPFSEGREAGKTGDPFALDIETALSRFGFKKAPVWINVN